MCQVCLKMSLDLILLCFYSTFLCDTLHTSDGVMKSKNSIKTPNCFSLPWKKSGNAELDFIEKIVFVRVTFSGTVVDR